MQESDHRVLLTKLAVNQEHLQKDFNRIALAIEKNTETQTKQSADIHEMLMSVSASVGRVDRLESDRTSMGIRLTNAETFIAGLKPEVERRRKIIDAVTSKLAWAVIAGIFGLILYINPFK